MTNNEKVQKIRGIVIDAATEKTLTSANICSAEWAYKKGWHDAMVRIKTIVCDIIDQEER